jgi:hypothetical protein
LVSPLERRLQTSSYLSPPQVETWALADSESITMHQNAIHTRHQASVLEIARENINQLGANGYGRISIGPYPPRPGMDILSNGANESSTQFMPQLDGTASAVLPNLSFHRAEVSTNPNFPNLTTEDEIAVRILLDNCFNVTAAGFDKVEALHWAAKEGHEAVISLLLRNGTATDSLKCGHTALLQAARSGHPEVMRLLLENNANVDYRNRKEQSAIGWATFLGNEEAVWVLLDY